MTTNTIWDKTIRFFTGGSSSSSDEMELNSNTSLKNALMKRNKFLTEDLPYELPSLIKSLEEKQYAYALRRKEVADHPPSIFNMGATFDWENEVRANESVISSIKNKIDSLTINCATKEKADELFLNLRKIRQL